MSIKVGVYVSSFPYFHNILNKKKKQQKTKKTKLYYNRKCKKYKNNCKKVLKSATTDCQPLKVCNGNIYVYLCMACNRIVWLEQRQGGIYLDRYVYEFLCIFSHFMSFNGLF